MHINIHHTNDKSLMADSTPPMDGPVADHATPGPSNVMPTSVASPQPSVRESTLLTPPREVQHDNAGRDETLTPLGALPPCEVNFLMRCESSGSRL